MKRFRIFSLWMVFWAVAPGIYAQAPAPAAMQSAYGEKIHIDGVPRAGKINQHLYRGAQPKPAAMAELKKMGITTVVDLRGEDNQTMNAERAQAEAQGLHFVSIPVGRFSSPTNEQVVQFLSLFRDHPDQTVFVHCHYGEDRTGVFVASYRMTMEHWPELQAENEMKFFGFNRHWQRDMKEFVRDYPGRLTTAPALVNFQKTLIQPNPLPALQ
jgi:protein tyrosine/serine phosphatase